MVFPGEDLLICSTASPQKIEAEQSSISTKAGKREIKSPEILLSLVSCCNDKLASKKSQKIQA